MGTPGQPRTQPSMLATEHSCSSESARQPQKSRTWLVVFGAVWAVGRWAVAVAQGRGVSEEEEEGGTVGSSRRRCCVFSSCPQTAAAASAAWPQSSLPPREGKSKEKKKRGPNAHRAAERRVRLLLDLVEHDHLAFAVCVCGRVSGSAGMLRMRVCMRAVVEWGLRGEDAALQRAAADTTTQAAGRMHAQHAARSSSSGARAVGAVGARAFLRAAACPVET